MSEEPPRKKGSPHKKQVQAGLKEAWGAEVQGQINSFLGAKAEANVKWLEGRKL